MTKNDVKQGRNMTGMMLLQLLYYKQTLHHLEDKMVIKYK